MELEFSGEVYSWRGPAPYHFVAVPEPERSELADVARLVSYGWGMIPVTGRIGDTEFTTSLWPREGGYVVPVKDAVRRAEGIELDDVVTVVLRVTHAGGLRQGQRVHSYGVVVVTLTRPARSRIGREYSVRSLLTSVRPRRSARAARARTVSAR